MIFAVFPAAAQSTPPVPLGIGGESNGFELRFEREAPHLAGGLAAAGVALVVPRLVGAASPTLVAPSDGYRDPLFGELSFPDDRPWAAPFSDSVAATTVAASLLVPLEARRGSAARNLGRSLVQVEVLLLGQAVTAATKATVRAARPYVQAGRCVDAGSDTLACDTGQDTWYVSYDEAHASFPSGHTSLTAASVFGWATIRLQATDRRFGWDDLAVYALATGLTASVGVARVEAGAHHPTDVLAGGLLGAALGIGVPWVHRPHPR